MNSSYTRMAGIAILASGLFFGCTTLNIFKHSPKDTSKGNSSTLASANQSIQKNPNRPTPYYLKGLALDKMALATKDPVKRRPIYSQMRSSFLNARKLSKGNEKLKPGEYANIDHVLSEDWSNEHNTGVGILKRDSTLSKDTLQKALAYIQNATTILPDSAISFRVESDIYYQLGDLDKSIEAADEAMKNDSSNADDYLQRLGFLYTENQQYDSAISAYKELLEYRPGDMTSLNSLTNVYIAKGEPENAASVLQELIRKDSLNAQYRLAYGIQLFDISQDYIDSLTSIQQTIADSNAQTEYQGLPDSVLQDSANIIEGTVNDYLNEAENQLTTAQKMDSTDEHTLVSLGTFYDNTAAKFIKLKDYVTDPNKVEDYESRIRGWLKKSLPYLEKAVHNEPDNKQYWKALYKIYHYLDMSEKAKEALSKF